MRKKRKHSIKEADLRYDALMDLMSRRRKKSDDKFKCYKLPVTAISEKFGVAGNEVTDLLRSRPEPCSLNPGDLKCAPWIDFLAVGRVGIAETNDIWIALTTSDSELAITALAKSNVEPLNAPRITETERIKVFTSVIGKIRAHPKSSEAGPAIDLQSIHARYLGRVKVQNLSQEDLDTDDPEILLICIGNCSEEKKAFLINMGAPNLLFFESFDEFETVAKSELRFAFGNGWFCNVDRVLYDLGKKNSKKDVNAVVEFSPRIPFASSAGIAAAAACKLATFGWLPPHWNRIQSLLKVAKPGQERKTALDRLFGEDVRIFPLPRVEVPGEGPLLVNDAEDLVNSTWLSYESSYPDDKVILAIEMTAYGSREKPNTSSDQPASKDDHYFVLPLNFGAIGFLRRILPSLRMEMIGYTPGNSAATHAGVLERLVWLFHENPKDVEVKARLKHEFRSLSYPGSVPFGRRSPSEESERIELDIVQAKISAELRDLPTTISEQAGGAVVESFSKLLEICEKGEDDRGEALAHAFRILGEMLELDPASIMKLMEPGSSSNGEIYQDLRDLEKEAAANGKKVKAPKLTRESDYPQSRIWDEISHIAALSKHGRIAVPELIGNWITDLFRLVWLVPMDRLEPSPCDPIRSGSTFPGSRLSHRYYPCLFSSDDVEGAIPVDLDLLLEIASASMKSDAKSRTRGWLVHRVSETNEMMAGMMVHAGYVPDYPLHSLPFDFESPKGNLEMLLERLDSRLIIRCIRGTDGGVEKLRQWSAEIGEKVRKSLSDRNNEGNREESIQARFGIFGDPAGIAVAALDCCRVRIGNGKGSRGNHSKNPYRVYFLPSKLQAHFRPRVVTHSKGAKAYSDEFRDISPSCTTPDEEDSLAGVEIKLGRLLIANPFNLNRAASVVHDWYLEEGMMRGESPEDLLEDLSMELFPDGQATTGFHQNCLLLLKTLETRTSG